ncbi:hypothetical protein NON00_13095 [Roseomonas sp. GC11]|uniref:hypothetical protein n=1 Tax=Roseomonas sp. GC11 TaxID=2950546 RepID=UPI00210C75DE|nr:hypothetical protein [Roseomonas sp. GC11]MCQ4160864.1 hypothetical protein [Roseomonas sp. GC11]
MDLHIRRRIRDVAVEALIGLPTTGDRVRASRTSAPDELPALQVWCPSDTVERVSNRDSKRTVDVAVLGWSDGEDEALEDTLDAMALEVERALTAVRLFGAVGGGSCDAVSVETEIIEFKEDGQPVSTVGKVKALFRVNVHHPVGSPTASS